MQAFAIANEAFASTTDTTTTTEAQKFQKPNREAARLAAVNGVVIPSKVAPGNRPNQGKLINYISGAQDSECNICGRGFSSPSHARPHFAVCVGRNGNPYGVKWDDAHSSSNLANFPVREIQVRSVFYSGSLFAMRLMWWIVNLLLPSQRAQVYERWYQPAITLPRACSKIRISRTIWI